MELHDKKTLPPPPGLLSVPLRAGAVQTLGVGVGVRVGVGVGVFVTVGVAVGIAVGPLGVAVGATVAG